MCSVRGITSYFSAFVRLFRLVAMRLKRPPPLPSACPLQERCTRRRQAYVALRRPFRLVALRLKHPPPPSLPPQERYTRRLQAQDDASRALWDRQREVKEAAGTNQAQTAMLTELARLLRAKLAMSGRHSGAHAAVFDGHVAGANVMTF